MTASKIRIKMGEVEVEYEGSEQFLKKELSGLLESITELHAKTAAKPSGNTNGSSNGVENGSTNPPTGNVVGTTATLAGKLKAKSANDLIIAAAAQLTLVGGKAEFSRKELLDNVKSATGYYKESMRKNFTNYLNGRVKAGQLVEPRNGYYALSAGKKSELEGALVT